MNIQVVFSCFANNIIIGTTFQVCPFWHTRLLENFCWQNLLWLHREGHRTRGAKPWNPQSSFTYINDLEWSEFKALRCQNIDIKFQHAVVYACLHKRIHRLVDCEYSTKQFIPAGRVPSCFVISAHRIYVQLLVAEDSDSKYGHWKRYKPPLY